MRAAWVNNRTGIVAATGKGPNEGKVFVLFNGDDENESLSGWFPESVAVGNLTPVEELVIGMELLTSAGEPFGHVESVQDNGGSVSMLGSEPGAILTHYPRGQRLVTAL